MPEQCVCTLHPPQGHSQMEGCAAPWVQLLRIILGVVQKTDSEVMLATSVQTALTVYILITSCSTCSIKFYRFEDNLLLQILGCGHYVDTTKAF